MKLRPATMEDARLLFLWRNDPVTRSASHNTAPLEYNEHREWLEAALKSRTILIAEIDETPVGTVQIDGDGVLSWTVAPEFRNRGTGKAMVSAAIARFPDRTFRAEVKESNIGSRKIAEACGMVLEESRHGVLYYRTGPK